MEKENVIIAGTEKGKKRRALLNLKKLEEAAGLPVPDRNITCEYIKFETPEMFNFKVFTDPEEKKVDQNVQTQANDGPIKPKRDPKKPRRPVALKSVIDENLIKTFLPEPPKLPVTSKTPSRKQ